MINLRLTVVVAALASALLLVPTVAHAKGAMGAPPPKAPCKLLTPAAVRTAFAMPDGVVPSGGMMAQVAKMMAKKNGGSEAAGLADLTCEYKWTDQKAAMAFSKNAAKAQKASKPAAVPYGLQVTLSMTWLATYSTVEEAKVAFVEEQKGVKSRVDKATALAQSKMTPEERAQMKKAQEMLAANPDLAKMANNPFAAKGGFKSTLDHVNGVGDDAYLFGIAGHNALNVRKGKYVFMVRVNAGPDAARNNAAASKVANAIAKNL